MQGKYYQFIFQGQVLDTAFIKHPAEIYKIKCKIQVRQGIDRRLVSAVESINQ